jgi:hypothetical protein
MRNMPKAGSPRRNNTVVLAERIMKKIDAAYPVGEGIRR